jgi:hypothetical protein
MIPAAYATNIDGKRSADSALRCSVKTHVDSGGQAVDDIALVDTARRRALALCCHDYARHTLRLCRVRTHATTPGEWFAIQELETNGCCCLCSTASQPAVVVHGKPVDCGAYRIAPASKADVFFLAIDQVC